MSAHSPIGASSMSRWAECPGSIRLSKGLKTVESSYAMEGTKAHELAARILECELAGQPWGDDDVDPEMLEAVQVYVKEVLSNAKGNTVLIEHRGDLNQIHPGLFGTCDNITFVKKEKLLICRDYKHGAGIAVDVKNNSQLKYYSLMALLSTDFPCEEVQMTIVQPRCAHPDGPIRSERISSLELMDFAGELKEAAVRTEDPNAPLVPGDHCRFCPAAGICPEISKQAQLQAVKDFSEVSNGHSYDVKELAKTLNWLPILKTWLESVHEFAYAQAQKGVKIPGWKLVAKQARRKWIDEKAAEAALRREFTDTAVREFFDPPTLKSVAQLEKVIHEKHWPKVVPLISNVSTGDVLVPESDKRPPIVNLDDFAVREMFD